MSDDDEGAAGENGEVNRIIQFLIEGVLTAALGIFGILGNVVSIKVLSQPQLNMLPTFRHLLKMLSTFDAIFLFFTLSLFCISAWSSHYNDYIRPWLTPYWLPVIQISLTGSVWTTIAVSVERYCTVCLSMRYNTVQHLFYTLPILAFSFVFNIPRFFELYTVSSYINEVKNETTGEMVNVTVNKPVPMPTAMRESHEYSRDYVVIANSLALVIIPFFALIILNGSIYRTIGQATRLHNAISSNQRRDHKVAMMLLTIVIVFIICHSIRSIVNVYECIQMAMHGYLKHWPNWIETLVHINHFALVVNSSINILIYACKDEKFLNVLLITIKYKRPMPPDSTTAVTRVENNAVNNTNAARGERIIMTVRNGKKAEDGKDTNGDCPHEDTPEAATEPEEKTLLPSEQV